MSSSAPPTDSPPPADGAAQPDTDADFRHTPSPSPPGNVATDNGLAANRGGLGWADPGSSEALRGARTAGGVDPNHPHLFHLSDAPASVFDGGGLHGAHGENWPIVRGQRAAAYIARLRPGGVREPHWHPSAWEMNFAMQGRARWTFGPEATQDSFEVGKGDVVFAPQGHVARRRPQLRVRAGAWPSSVPARRRWWPMPSIVAGAPLPSVVRASALSRKAVATSAVYGAAPAGVSAPAPRRDRRCSSA